MASNTPGPFVPAMSVMADAWGNRGPSRNLTAVAVSGELGASYTVYATNWKCGECQADNYPRRDRCHRCRAPKSKCLDDASASGNGLIVNGRDNPWREVLDPASKQLYYYNTATQATSWDRPEEMGPAPHATGWFGRGAAGSQAATQYEEANAGYLNRPARKQADAKMHTTSMMEGQGEYNIWYGKYLGDHDGKGGRGKALAEARCVMATDAGYTKADKHSNNAKFFCLFFARGNCAYGPSCQYHHRVPVRSDVARLLGDELHDVFGRDRHKDHREDMDGVGSVLKPCRTLFVGAIACRKYADPRACEAALWRGFGEWGEVENVNLISRLSIAFVRFRSRAGAEFAKEAMANQTLEHGEVLNVRWAYDDPNPVALEAAERADADAVVNMMNMRGVALAPGASGSNSTGSAGGGSVGGGAGAGSDAASPSGLEPGQAAVAPPSRVVEVSSVQPDDYALPAAKRLRAHELEEEEGESWQHDQHNHDGSYSGENDANSSDCGNTGSRSSANGSRSEPAMTASEAAYLDQQYAKAGVVWYPDTDLQYAAHAAPSSGDGGGVGTVTPAPPLVVTQEPATSAAGSRGAAVGVVGAGAPVIEGANSAWRPATDPSSGNTYFYNEMTRETAWALDPKVLQASAAQAAAAAVASGAR